MTFQGDLSELDDLSRRRIQHYGWKRHKAAGANAPPIESDEPADARPADKLRRGEMTRTAKVAYIGKHGLQGYLKLPW